MNIAHRERSERIFSSTGPTGLTSDHAKFFAYPVQSESTCLKGFGCGRTPGLGVDEAADFNRFAFKALSVFGKEGLSFSAHLGLQDEVFKQAFAIYAEAFSGLERRSLDEHRDVLSRPHYRFSAVLREGAVVGVLAWWKLSGFCFVEHFAIAAAQRSGGIGRQVIELLQAHVAEPVVVDVEPFEASHLAARRVAFYSRLGFAYCGQSVTLPAYRGKGFAPSNLMVWGAEPDRAESERIFGTICREIYRVDVSGRCAGVA